MTQTLWSLVVIGEKFSCALYFQLPKPEFITLSRGLRWQFWGSLSDLIIEDLVAKADSKLQTPNQIWT